MNEDVRIGLVRLMRQRFRGPAPACSMLPAIFCVLVGATAGAQQPKIDENSRLSALIRHRVLAISS